MDKKFMLNEKQLILIFMTEN